MYRLVDQTTKTKRECAFQTNFLSEHCRRQNIMLSLYSCLVVVLVSHVHFTEGFGVSSRANKYTLSSKDCHSMHNLTTVRDTEGIISGQVGTNTSGSVLSKCGWRLIVPQKRYLVMAASILGFQGPCGSSILLSFHMRFGGKEFTYGMHCSGNFSKSPVFFLRSNTVLISFQSVWDEDFRITEESLQYEILFTSTTEKLWTRMIPVWTSMSSGYVMSPGFDVTRSYGPFLDAWCNVTIPDQHVMMVSFPHFALLAYSFDRIVFGYPGFVELLSISLAGVVVDQQIFYQTEYLSPQLFYSAVLAIHFKSGDALWDREQRSGMNMSFSFHPVHSAPEVLDTGFFNCSVPHYSSFGQHLHCNLQQECEGGEDEGTHCPFSSPSCKGRIEAGGKCYFPVELDHILSLEKARGECEKRGGDLAMMKTAREWKALWSLLQLTRNQKCAYIGLHLDPMRLHRLYSRTWIWLDGSPSFHANVTAGHFDGTDTSNVKLAVFAEGWLLKSATVHRQRRKGCSRCICQNEYNKTNYDVTHARIPTPKPAVSKLAAKQLGLVPCPGGHFTHDFLRCYVESRCGVRVSRSYCSVSVRESRWSSVSGAMNDFDRFSVAMFTCASKTLTIPYSLVCDIRDDCLDQSDESFCVRSRSCGGDKSYLCKNGQCLPFSLKCDRKADCLDGSDEDNCDLYTARREYDFIFLNKKSSPSVVMYTQSGAYKQTHTSASEPCPASYFRCPSSGDCLPVYLLCNGVRDCMQNEDESGCENYTCPGFYQCLRSDTCLDVTHVCDGFAQCPMEDDEAYCDLSCPFHCHCQGLEMVCRRPFHASSFPEIRYLDASHSLMTLTVLGANTFLVYVNLASCDIVQIGNVSLPSLQVLDLSWNSIRLVDMDEFLPFKKLQFLRLVGNPLTLVTGGKSDEHHLYLSHVDFSHTLLSDFSSEPLQRFFVVKSINISYCCVASIQRRGFQATPALQQIDLRGNHIKSYPENIFKPLNRLRVIYSSDYKLCCPALLPRESVEDLCFYPHNELSSCDDLLRADLYRLFLWLVCVSSVVGNLGCLLSRMFILKHQTASGFHVFVSSLSFADCVMGVYLAFVGVADQVYSGNYYLYEDTWVSSMPCSVSGAMSLLSSEVSAITICYITLDRFIALRFPFSTLRFGRQAAIGACVLAWVTGLALALVPLFAPHWEFYSQTGICIPLPVTRKKFKGHNYSFGVMIVFNFVLFFVVATGQAFIYHSVRINSMTVNTSQKVHDVTIARRLLTVVVSDFLCWFPIGLLGLLASAGVPISGEANIAVAIFILPLNSALNPFLYTFNVLVERHRKEKEEQILKYLESMCETADPRAMFSPASSATLRDTEQQRCVQEDIELKEKAVYCLRKALEQRMVSVGQIRAVLYSSDDGIREN